MGGDCGVHGSVQNQANLRFLLSGKLDEQMCVHVCHLHELRSFVFPSWFETTACLEFFRVRGEL